MSELWSDEFKQTLDAAIEKDKETVLRYVLSRISAKQRTIFPISGAMNFTFILDNGYSVKIEESPITVDESAHATAKKLEELASAIQRYANSDGQRILTAKDILPLTNKASKP